MVIICAGRSRGFPQGAVLCHREDLRVPAGVHRGELRHATGGAARGENLGSPSYREHDSGAHQRGLFSGWSAVLSGGGIH